MKATSYQLRAVLISDGGSWIVQGVEYDVVAYGSDIPGARRAFERMLVERCVIAENLGRDPLEGVPPAPARFKAMFEEADEELSRVKGSPYASAPSVTMRLANVV